MKHEQAKRFLTVLFCILLCWLTLPVVVFSSEQAEVEQGLAAKYPCDKGIESDPAVIFASGFEDGFEKWTRFRNRPVVKIVSDEAIVHSGSASAEITATRGKDSGGDVGYNLAAGVNQLYMRFYCRFHKDTVGVHHFVNMGGNSKDYSPGGHAGQRPQGDKHFGTTIEPPNDKSSWLFYTYWHQMHSWENPDGRPNNPPDGDGRSFYGNNFVPEGQPSGLVREQWICVEFMTKLNAVGKSDGEQAFWINGKKMGHWRPGEPVGTWMRDMFRTSGQFNTDPKPFEGFSWRTDAELKINYVNLQWYVSERVAKEGQTDKNIVYFDDVVLATEYIGPMVDEVSTKPETPKVDFVRPLEEDPIKQLPDVFFFEDLETIGELKESFHNIGGNFRVTGEDVVSGQKALQMIYIPKEQMTGDPGNAGYLGHFFGDNPLTRRIKNKKPYNRVYARWYHKFEEGFKTQQSRGTLPPKMARMRCYAPDWKAVYTVLFWIEDKDGHITVERHTKAPNVHREWLPNYHTTWGFLNEGNMGRWVHLELCVSLGEGPRSDRIQAWADGMLICDIPNEDLAAGFKELTLNAMQWDCYWNGGSPASQSRFYDDLVLSTEPIGPVRTPLNPVIVKAASKDPKGPKQQQWEVEVAQSRQIPVSLADKVRTPEMRHTTVWKGIVKDGGTAVAVDSDNGKFVGPRQSRAELAPNTLHSVRLRQKSGTGIWSDWSKWHSAFATTWRQNAKKQDKTPPVGFLLKHNK